MLYEYEELALRIKEKCGSQRKFSLKMGLSERTVSLKLSSRREWKQSEIQSACKILEIAYSDIPLYFFKMKVQN